MSVTIRKAPIVPPPSKCPALPETMEVSPVNMANSLMALRILNICLSLPTYTEWIMSDITIISNSRNITIVR